MYNQPSYQVAYANFVMDQHEDIPPTSQNTSPILENRPILQQQENKAMEFKKPVRTRISYSHSQQVILEREFQGSAYLYRSRRIEIAARLGIEEKHVKVWFQNRRMKSKRETLQNGNKVTMPHRTLIYRPQHDTLKKPTQFTTVHSEPLRKVHKESARCPLPIHKPMEAQLVKGVCVNVAKVFKPQLIVQMPVPVTQPSMIPICRTTNTTSIKDHLGQQLTQQQQRQLQNQPFLHQVQQVLQQALDVQHKLQQHQPPPQPMLEVPTPSAIIPRDNIIDRLRSPEFSEESVDLDKYLNDLERRVEALKEEEQNQQQQTIMKIQQDLGDCVKELDSLSNADMNMAALSPKIDDDFDIRDLLDDLDRYVSYSGTAPELDFDNSLFSPDINNCPIFKYDPTLPLVDFSFDDWALVD